MSQKQLKFLIAIFITSCGIYIGAGHAVIYIDGFFKMAASSSGFPLVYFAFPAIFLYHSLIFMDEKNRFLWVLHTLTFILCVGSITFFNVNQKANTLRQDFQRELALVAPHLDEADEEQLQIRFYQMTNRKEYWQILHDLQEMASTSE